MEELNILIIKDDQPVDPGAPRAYLEIDGQLEDIVRDLGGTATSLVVDTTPGALAPTRRPEHWEAVEAADAIVIAMGTLTGSVNAFKAFFMADFSKKPIQVLISTAFEDVEHEVWPVWEGVQFNSYHHRERVVELIKALMERARPASAEE